MHYVYILKIRKNNLYCVGSTPDLKRRFNEYNKGLVKSTATGKQFMLVYCEDCRNYH